MPVSKTQKKSPSRSSDISVDVATSKNKITRLRKWVRTYVARGSHRSFRLTKRRDYARAFVLPGYWTFSLSVVRLLWHHKKTFILLVVLYAVISGLLVGMASQETYSALADTLRQTGADVANGGLGALPQAGLLFTSAISGGLSQRATDVQQVYAGLIGLLSWLTTVWLLRNILAGHKVKLRDGIYNASAPLLSTFIVALVLVVQLLPLAFAFIGYYAASTSGLLNNGVEAMLFWVAAGLLGVLSLYLITSTFIALVVVTLPGMYPLRALKTAGDLVVGRRIRILLRMVWMLVGIGLTWIIVMIPIILFDTWIKTVWSAIAQLPTIPIVLLVMTSLTVVWSASYIYLLYRKVVSDDSRPA